MKLMLKVNDISTVQFSDVVHHPVRVRCPHFAFAIVIIHNSNLFGSRTLISDHGWLHLASSQTRAAITKGVLGNIPCGRTKCVKCIFHWVG